ncbi:MAG: hypothetical protein UY60_C0001G0007 [Parcubacteria group bacterium GW2011_GWB1_50_9]|uniref:Uncharacterized protein n=1 Tax=Candidatus Adlerbacteria bacterium GW2011_GWC1_50_9 TaxID=1618608 RepID=A0A0G1ZP87_9BACT|nr:MAG: hypothetical protein UY60_C0001G0007 [Parcubacteria group bacterium GW2011_GWB1_50_9]KKW21239.1 MAG: hypothetical protein UY61_C0011G0005 [Candidatus Adlerbacteria bacterium GW2011_GWC1_50_9]
MVFPVFLVIFIVFWTGYLLFGVSMVYHIKEYSLPAHPVPRIFTTAFAALSIVLFLLSGFFLMGIYRIQ